MRLNLPCRVDRTRRRAAQRAPEERGPGATASTTLCLRGRRPARAHCAVVSGRTPPGGAPIGGWSIGLVRGISARRDHQKDADACGATGSNRYTRRIRRALVRPLARRIARSAEMSFAGSVQSGEHQRTRTEF